MNETIRIIGGRYRGKKLSFIAQADLRPTPDRVRETLFNWLMHDIRDAVCLDAFAGSGALGFEAFSRGAQQVTLIEQSHPTYLQLKKHAALFNTAQLKVIETNFLDYIKTCRERYDIIFFDPPFSKPEYYHDIDQLGAACLKPDGLLYIESRESIELNPLYWKSLKLKKAGQVTYGLYQRLCL